MIDQACSAAMRTSASLDAIAYYLQLIMEDGDYLNDMLTHVPACGQSLIQVVGYTLALALGF